MWWCCHFYNIFTLCLPNEIRRTERGIFFRLSRLLHNCLIREQHNSGPSELSLLADHPVNPQMTDSQHNVVTRDKPLHVCMLFHIFQRVDNIFQLTGKTLSCKFDWRLHHARQKGLSSLTQFTITIENSHTSKYSTAV